MPGNRIPKCYKPAIGSILGKYYNTIKAASKKLVSMPPYLIAGEMELDMPSYRINRINEDVKRELSEIFRILKDPRISTLLSIVKVDVAGDLSFAKVYISAVEGKEKTLESIKGLKSATGYIKHELGERLKLRKLPELRFLPDDSIEHGMQIARMLEDLKDD